MQKMLYLCGVKYIRSSMNRPVFREYKTPAERAAMFEKWIHLREEWEAHVIQREKELGIYNEVVG